MLGADPVFRCLEEQDLGGGGGIGGDGRDVLVAGNALRPELDGALACARLSPVLGPSSWAGPSSCSGLRAPLASLAVQQKEITQSPSTSTITLVTSTQPTSLVTSSGGSSTLASSISADLPIATASADVAADIAKYTSKVSGGGGRGRGHLAGFCGCTGRMLGFRLLY